MLINHPYYFLIYSNSNTAFYIVEACHYFTVYVFHYNYIFLNEKMLLNFTIHEFQITNLINYNLPCCIPCECKLNNDEFVNSTHTHITYFLKSV